MPIVAFNPPSADLAAVRSFQDLRDRAIEWIRNFTQYVNNYINQDLLLPLNSDLFGFGADIPSAAAINPTNRIHLVTGAAAISTINPPSNFGGGLLVLAARDGFSVTTGGNIALAQAIPANHAIFLSYLPTINRWFGVTS